MSELCVTGCGRPTPEIAVLLCKTCSWGLECDLGDVGALVAMADDTLARLAKVGAANDGGSGSDQHPLPLHAGMYEAKLQLETVLVGWTRELAERHGEEQDLPGPSMASIAAWLAVRMWRIVTHPAADDIHDEISSSVARVRALVDRPAEREFVGVCERDGCPGWLYAKPHATTVRCRECGHKHETGEAWTSTMDELEGRLMTASEIAGLATYHGIPRRRAMKLIGSWVDRQRIQAAAHAASGEPTYQFGTILDMLLNTPTRVRRAS